MGNSFNTTVHPETFVSLGRNGGGGEVGTVSVSFHNAERFGPRSKVTARALVDADGDIEVADFVGVYRTSRYRWRATVMYRKATKRTEVDFGNRDGLSYLRSEIYFDPEGFKALAEDWHYFNPA